ncbi:MAG: RNA binding protein fox-1 homolog [Sedimentisphaerales bacterium]|nr:RNA binding protein fox-1 homolog [Sedimentisphaerales bacterium]
MYTFSVNGEYAAGREDARLVLNKNLFGKFSYFSKVEWKFYNSRFGRVTYPNKQEALAASEKLLAVILPVLEREHWPSGLW